MIVGPGWVEGRGLGQPWEMMAISAFRPMGMEVASILMVKSNSSS